MIDFKEIYRKKFEKYKKYIIEHHNEKDAGLNKIVNNEIKAYSITPVKDEQNSYLIQIWEKRYGGVPDYSYKIIFDDPGKATYTNLTIDDSVKAFVAEIDKLFNNSDPITIKFPDGSIESNATAITKAGWEAIKKYYLGENND